MFSILKIGVVLLYNKFKLYAKTNDTKNLNIFSKYIDYSYYP